MNEDRRILGPTSVALLRGLDRARLICDEPSQWRAIDPGNPAPPCCEYDPVGYDFAAGKTFEITKEMK